MRVWLREIRMQKGFSQEKIAEQLEVTRPYYTQIEMGYRRPSPKLAQKLGSILEFDWTKFFNDN